MAKLGKNLLLLAFVVAGIFIVTAVFQATKNSGINIFHKENKEIVESLSPEDVSGKVIEFINRNLLSGTSTASVIDTLKDRGMYKIKFVIDGQEEREIEVYASLDGEIFFPDYIDLTEAELAPVEQETTIGGFSVSGEQVCQEGGKPIVYFFGSEQCGFCQWEHPIVERVVEKFGNEISFHNNMDSDNDQEIFSKYSTGGIPTIVIGCRYYRVGAGQSSGEELEESNLTALICKLTGNKPSNVCEEVMDIINTINI